MSPTRGTGDTPLTGLGIVLSDPNTIRNSSTGNRDLGVAKRARASTVADGDSVLKSSLRMRGLSNVENGRSMVRINLRDPVSGFKEGSVIHLDDDNFVQSNQEYASKRSLGPVRSRSASHLIPHRIHLAEHPASPSDSDSTSELASNASFSSLDNSQLLELDLQLENNTVVEGSSLNGWITIKSRETSPVLLIGPPKIRVIGFEAVSSARHTFFHHLSLLELASPSLSNIFVSSPQADGPKEIRGGKHTIPFSLLIPCSLGAKGSVTTRSQVNVRYIVLISFKCRDSNNCAPPIKRIAHFYRACHIFPLLDPSRVLASDPVPLIRSSSKTLFLGGPGKLKMLCTLHRTTWVAGQQCWMQVRLCNDTAKRVKSLTFTLYRHTTTFKMMPQLNPGGLVEVDIDSCVSSTSQRKLVNVVLEGGIKGSKDAVSGKGWWCGVDAKSESTVIHGILLPPDALTITRSQLLEITYVLRVTAHTASLTTDLSVELPITIVNFTSLYPPPSATEGSSLRVDLSSEHLTATTDSGPHGQPLTRRRPNYDENKPLGPHSLYDAESLAASYKTNERGLFSAKGQYPTLLQPHLASRRRSQPKEHRRSLPDIRSAPHTADPNNVLIQTGRARGGSIEMSCNVQRRFSTLDAFLDSDEEVAQVVRSTPIHDFEMDSQSSGTVSGAKSDFTTLATSNETRWSAYTSLPVDHPWDGGARNQRLAPLGPRSRSQAPSRPSPPTSHFQQKEPHTLLSKHSTSEQGPRLETDFSISSGCSADEIDRPTERSGTPNMVQPVGHISLDKDIRRVLLSADAVNATQESVSGDSLCPPSLSRHLSGLPPLPLDKNTGVSEQSLGYAYPISKQPDINAGGQQARSDFRPSTSTSIQERIAKLEMAGLDSRRSIF